MGQASRTPPLHRPEDDEEEREEDETAAERDGGQGRRKDGVVAKETEDQRVVFTALVRQVVPLTNSSV